MKTNCRILGIIVIALAALSAVLLITPRKEKEPEIVSFWQEIYGENRIIKLSDSDTYYLFEPSYTLNGRPGLNWIPRFTLRPFVCEALELYTGDEYSLYAENQKVHIGDDVRIKLVNNSENSISPAAEFYLDMLCDGIWYPLNPDFSFPGAEYTLEPQGEYPIKITPYTLNQASLFEYNAEKEMYVRIEDERTVELRVGHYRYTQKIMDGAAKEIYYLACEFDVIR